MSRVNSTASRAPGVSEIAAETPAALPTEPLAAPMAVDEASLFDSSAGSSKSSLSEVHTRNVVVDATLTATELNLGKSVPLSRNLAAVFADGIEGVTTANTKVVITGIELQNVFSDVPKRVSVSANLFQNKAQQTGLKNEAGWLYAQQSSELASEAAEHVSYGGDGSYVNLCSLLPFEQARHTSCAIYTPTNSSLNQRHLQDYGNISTKEQLWEGIVAVTPTTYYVPAESVVCKVIRYVSFDQSCPVLFPCAPIHPSSPLCLLPLYLQHTLQQKLGPLRILAPVRGKSRRVLLSHRQAHSSERREPAVRQRDRTPAVHLARQLEAAPAVQRGAVQLRDAQLLHAAQNQLQIPSELNALSA